MTTLSILFAILAKASARNIYDVFANIRSEALNITGTLTSVGVAIASILAVFTLLKISNDIMAGRGAEFSKIIRPFIIILVIANLGLILRGMDSALNTITMKIMEVAQTNEDEMNIKIQRADEVLSFFRRNEARLNGYAEQQRNCQKSREEINNATDKALQDLAAAQKTLANGGGESVDLKPGLDGRSINYKEGEKGVMIDVPVMNSHKEIKEYASPTGKVMKEDVQDDKVDISTKKVLVTSNNQNELADRMNRMKEEQLAKVNKADSTACKNVKTTIDTEAKKYNEKRGIILAQGETPLDGLKNYIASDINPDCTEPQQIKDNMSDFHGLSSITNWLANKLYLIMNAWAELTLIILAFLAPFIFAFSVLPNFANGISGFFARYIQISFWKVCAAAVNWASTTVRFAIMDDRISSLSALYEDTTGQMAKISTYDFITTCISIATIFAMFSIPKIASYVIESSGTGGAHDAAARGLGGAAKKPMTLAGGAMKKKIFG